MSAHYRTEAHRGCCEISEKESLLKWVADWLKQHTTKSRLVKVSNLDLLHTTSRPLPGFLPVIKQKVLHINRQNPFLPLCWAGVCSNRDQNIQLPVCEGKGKGQIHPTCFENLTASHNLFDYIVSRVSN